MPIKVNYMNGSYKRFSKSKTYHKEGGFVIIKGEGDVILGSIPIEAIRDIEHLKKPKENPGRFKKKEEEETE